MKKGIHPEYSEIYIIMTDGASYKLKSTFRKKSALWKLDMDTKSHAFWNEGVNFNVLEGVGQRAKFKKRFVITK